MTLNALMMSAFLFSLQESEIKWASRWDTYLTMSDVQIHWFSIVNSVVVVFFLSGTSDMISDIYGSEESRTCQSLKKLDKVIAVTRRLTDR